MPQKEVSMSSLFLHSHYKGCLPPWELKRSRKGSLKEGWKKCQCFRKIVSCGFAILRHSGDINIFPLKTISWKVNMCKVVVLSATIDCFTLLIPSRPGCFPWICLLSSMIVFRCRASLFALLENWCRFVSCLEITLIS